MSVECAHIAVLKRSVAVLSCVLLKGYVVQELNQEGVVLE